MSITAFLLVQLLFYQNLIISAAISPNAPAPALLLTSYEAVSIVYPKEMGYERDFLQTVYKITESKATTTSTTSSATTTQTTTRSKVHAFDILVDKFVNDSKPKPEPFRIEDAVYDNLMSSMYIVISFSENGGCELIKLKQILVNGEPSASKMTDKDDPTTRIASNWSRHILLRNSSVSILSMELNEKKRRLYWLEFNKETGKWSIGVLKLASIDNLNDEILQNLVEPNLQYFTFNDPSLRFSDDGYSYISIIYDNFFEDDSETNSNNNSNSLLTNEINSNYINNHVVINKNRGIRKSNLVKRRKIKKRSETIMFISTNDRLNICFLSVMTCKDFFEEPEVQYTDGELNYDDQQNLSEYYDSEDIQPRPKQQTKSTANFGRLMGIQYDSKERTLYVADYGYDRIEKILIDNSNFLELDSKTKLSKIDLLSSVKSLYIQTLVNSNTGQLPINPIMSVAFDNVVFWTDFEDGLKSTVYKSPCIRPVYRVKRATTLKLIHITPKTSNKNANKQGENNGRAASLKSNQLPPDYDFYQSKISSAIYLSFNFNYSFLIIFYPFLFIFS